MKKTKELADSLKGFKGKEVILLSHKNADPDSFCSALVLYKLLKKIGIQTRLAAVESVSALSKNILEEDVNLEINPSLDSEALILLDVSSRGPLGNFYKEIRESDIYKIIIDHHPKSGKPVKADKNLILEDASSTVELVYGLLKELDIELDRKTAFELLYGMVAETAHLRYAKLNNFKMLSELMEQFNIELPEILNTLNTPLDISERIARIKALKRVNYKRIGDFIVAQSTIGSFEASSARALIRAGADVALVTSKKKNETRVSMRASSTFYKKTNIDLGKEVIQGIAKIIGGSGSGHPTAAGANGPETGKENEMLKYLVKEVKSKTS